MASIEKTILINGSYSPSLVNFRGHLICEFIKLGYRVHVSAPDFDIATRRKLEKMGVFVHDIALQRTSIGIVSDLKYFFRVRAIIRSNNIRKVLSYTIKPNIYGSLAAKSLGVDSVSMVTGLGYAFYKIDSLKHKLIGYVSRILYRLATNANRLVIFQNIDDRDDFLNFHAMRDVSKARIVNGSGVDTKYFAQASLPNAPVFLLIARFLISKGVRDYAEAAKFVMAERSDCRFLIAGFLDEGPDSIGQAELDYWVSIGIEYLGPLKDVRPAIEAASVYVLPSYREGTPRTVLEASSMGRASIVTNVPGCRETVLEKKTGLLVPARDPVALAQAMITLADSHGLRENMGNAAREFCIGKYDIQVVNADLIKYLIN